MADKEKKNLAFKQVQEHSKKHDKIIRKHELGNLKEKFLKDFLIVDANLKHEE